MSISVDDVYKQVLAITNKEGRGYIPAPEFNVLARKAQLDIFESLFHDYKMALLKPTNQSKLSDDLDMLREKIALHRVHNGVIATSIGGTVGTYSSSAHWIETIYSSNSLATKTVTLTCGSGSGVEVDETTILTLMAYYDGTGSMAKGVGDYEIIIDRGSGSVSGADSAKNIINVNAADTATVVATTIKEWINDNSPFHTATSSAAVVTITYNQDASLVQGTETVVNWTGASISNTTGLTGAGNKYFEEVDTQRWLCITSENTKLKPNSNRPIYCKDNTYKIKLYPPQEESLFYDYIKKPSDPKWIGTTDGEFFQYSADSSNDFELHASEEGSLVNKILELTGISMNKLEIAETALRNEQLNEADKNN
jgi:hypothetical protein